MHVTVRRSKLTAPCVYYCQCSGLSRWRSGESARRYSPYKPMSSIRHQNGKLVWSGWDYAITRRFFHNCVLVGVEGNKRRHIGHLTDQAVLGFLVHQLTDLLARELPCVQDPVSPDVAHFRQAVALLGQADSSLPALAPA